MCPPSCPHDADRSAAATVKSQLDTLKEAVDGEATKLTGTEATSDSADGTKKWLEKAVAQVQKGELAHCLNFGHA
jgi:hypothetical protein